MESMSWMLDTWQPVRSKAKLVFLCHADEGKVVKSFSLKQVYVCLGFRHTCNTCCTWFPRLSERRVCTQTYTCGDVDYMFAVAGLSREKNI